ncbi:hypothetical protein G7046_g9229 [Stylonectria norvegica]|nr:hypothetical protein G7046_g9229 [Stylonectria norvegica]
MAFPGVPRAALCLPPVSRCGERSVIASGLEESILNILAHSLDSLANHRNSDICKIILAIFLPPLGVFLERGCGADLLINILLTILGKPSSNASSPSPLLTSMTRIHSRHHPRPLHHSEILSAAPTTVGGLMDCRQARAGPGSLPITVIMAGAFSSSAAFATQDLVLVHR